MIEEIYNFANHNFKIVHEYKYFSNLAKKYLSSGESFFTIQVTTKDIDNWINEHPNDNKEPRDYLESIVIHKFVAEVLAKENIFVIHGSSIYLSDSKKGYIFVAPSGVGKSTHTSLLSLNMPSKVEYINGDKPFIDSDYYLYGSPWDGKEHLSNNVKIKLEKIFVIERATHPSYKKLSPKEALDYLFKQIHIIDMVESLDFILKICNEIPVYLISVNMEKESIDQTISLL